MTAIDEPRADHDARCTSWATNDPTRCSCRDEQGYTPRENWINGPLAVLDTETTGVSVDTDRVITATVVHIQPGVDPVIHQWLANPGVPVPAESTAVHHITDEHAREHGRPAPDVIAQIEATLHAVWSPTVPLVAYNCSFDLSILDAELRRHHGRGLRLAGHVIDPLVIDKHRERYRKGSRKLVDVCAHYNVRLDGAHDATEDALAAARVAWRIGQIDPRIGRADLATLHAQQAQWFAEQQRSFADYLRRKVAPTVEDSAERQAVLERADAVDAAASGWPMRATS